ncbi:MAG: TetR/AcrR family transcriptional regulator [Victivallaceae bacterium]|nr:TetR/AcrR family transcriptional regulator [Victivallaceae bacterium]
MNTKEKILLAAAEEFSSNGYHVTTTRNICEKAKVNIAAVNYHFSNKATLYKHVVDYLFDKTADEFRCTRTVANKKEWYQEIFNWVLDVLTSTTNPSSIYSWKSKILFREMLDPSELFPEFFKKYFEPYFASLEFYVRCGLPDDTAKEHVYIIVFSILSQCMFYEQSKVIVRQLFESNFLNKDNRIEQIVRYITDGVCSRLKFRKVEI